MFILKNIKWKEYPREECFEYFGKKYPYNRAGCKMCGCMETRVQPQSNEIYCIDCFDKTGWWVHPNIDLWYKSWSFWSRQGIKIPDRPDNFIKQ